MSGIDWSGADFRGPMLVEGELTPPCPGFAVGKSAMVVVRVQGVPDFPGIKVLCFAFSF